MGRVTEARYCAMGERCTQARFLDGKPSRLRSTSNSDLCEGCIQEGYTLDDAHSKPVPNEHVEVELLGCAICRKLAVAGYSDYYLCERHWEQLDKEGAITIFSPVNESPSPPEEAFSELLRAARVLFANNVTEEERLIPTLAFANRASALPELKALRDQFAEIEDDGALRKQFSADFYQRFRGLMPVAVLDEVLILRRVPMFLNAVTYPGATAVKEVVIDVFMRSVKPEEVAERYERWLVEENLAYEESNKGTFSWAFADAYLTMTVAPGKELNEGQVARFSSSGRQLMFPPPQLVAGFYESLRGSVHRKRFRGFAYALEGRQSGHPRSADKLIPACVAWYLRWYLRELGGISNKHKLARLINQHLLTPCGKEEIGATSDNAIWENIDKVANSIMRVDLALQTSRESHPTRVSETHT
jgi:hypothetical protein